MSTEASAEEQLRVLAQSSPAGFGYVANVRKTEDGSFESGFMYPPHVEHLNQAIVHLAAREYLKQGYTGIIVEMPPRHGKSEICSKYTPPWYIGCFPGHRVALASYEADFASSWGRAGRDLLEEWGPSLFAMEVDRRSSAADRWGVRRMTRGRPRKDPGGMITTGVGGPITGKGADLLIIDDPFKNFQEAQSKTIRNRVWNWWLSTARTRLEPGGVVIIIMTRWHEDDLIGRLLAASGESPQGTGHPLYDPLADKWIRIRYPAIAEGEDFLGRRPGEALWPERYHEEALARIKASVGAYIWGALYQQRPAPLEGGMFERDWFRIIDEVPRKDAEGKPLRVKKTMRRWDMAATEEAQGTDPDWTVGAKVHLMSDGSYVIVDIRRFRKNPDPTEREIQRIAVVDGKGVPIRMEQEPGSAGKTVIAHFKKLLRGWAFKGRRSTGSKETRAIVYSAAAERGDVYLLRADWNEEFLDEHVLFPNGTHDDQVDAVSGCIEDLNEKGGGITSW
jgi:predicted phage terminase large subunit-like protein